MEKYDHYVAVDWAQRNMAIARLTPQAKKPEVIDVHSSVSNLKLYLQNLAGTKILTIEESSTSQWLYTELFEHVDELIICNPLRNRLLQHGPKNDRIDAQKLALLLRSNLLEPVFHSGSEYFQLRKLTSGYNSVIKNGVRLKNQRAALFIAAGKNKRALVLETDYENFVCERLDQIIQANEAQVDIFISEFKKLKKINKLISNLTTIPGIQERSAVKLLAIVIDPKRFENKGRWLSYCGLIKLEKMSGGKSYGKRNPQYSREAKSVFKVAALSCIVHGNTENPFRCYYELLRNKGIADHDARHSVARRIAVITFGVMISNTPFKNNWKEQKAIIK